MPQLHWALVCRKMEINAETNNPTLHEIYDSVSAPSYPVKHSPMKLICKWEGEHGDEFKQTVQTVHADSGGLWHESDVVHVRISKRFNITTLDYDGFIVPKAGDYIFHIMADGLSIHSITMHFVLDQ